jgi:hypothetical protein
MRPTHLAAPLALAAATLAGCASNGAAHAPGSAPEVMSSDTLNKLAMHQATDAFSVIGRPDSSEKAANGTLYTWQAKVNGSVYIPTPAMTAGFIGGMPAGMEHSGGGQVYDHEVICRLRLNAGPTGLIEHLDFNGPRTACDPVKQRLTYWIKAVG